MRLEKQTKEDERLVEINGYQDYGKLYGYILEEWHETSEHYMAMGYGKCYAKIYVFRLQQEITALTDDGFGNKWTGIKHLTKEKEK